MEYKRKRQGKASEQRKIKKIRRKHRRRAEQQRRALPREENTAVAKAHERSEGESGERNDGGEHKKRRRRFGAVNAVKRRADLIRVTRQTEGFRRRDGLVHALCHQRVALVAQVRQKLVLHERTRLFPAQLLGSGAGELSKGLRQGQGSRPLSARGLPQR